MKICCQKCNMVWLSFPFGAKYQSTGDELDGWYWNCECGTSMFYPAKNDKATQELQRMRNQVMGAFAVAAKTRR